MGDIDSKELFDAVTENGANRKPFVIAGDFLDKKQRIAVPRAEGGWETQVVDDPDRAPSRISGKPVFFDIDSFCAYVTEFKDKVGKTKLFCDPESLTFGAVLDYHPADGTPSKCTHFAAFAPRLDVVFGKWKAQHEAGKMSQEAFARFVEVHSTEIKEPSPADMLEIAQDLNLHINIAYSSRQRLQNGLVSIVYTEQMQGNGGTIEGKLTIPEKMTVAMPIFFGGDPTLFTVMLRYYPEKSKPLTYAIEIHRLEYLIEEAFLALRARIGDATGVMPLIGRVTG